MHLWWPLTLQRLALQLAEVAAGAEVAAEAGAGAKGVVQLHSAELQRQLPGQQAVAEQ